MNSRTVTATLMVIVAGEDVAIVDTIAALVGDLLHGDLDWEINDMLYELLKKSDDYDPECECGTSYEEHLAIEDDSWRSETWIENVKVGDK